MRIYFFLNFLELVSNRSIKRIMRVLQNLFYKEKSIVYMWCVYMYLTNMQTFWRPIQFGLNSNLIFFKFDSHKPRISFFHLFFFILLSLSRFEPVDCKIVNGIIPKLFSCSNKGIAFFRTKFSSINNIFFFFFTNCFLIFFLFFLGQFW